MEPEVTGALIALGGGAVVWIATTLKEARQRKHAEQREDHVARWDRRHDGALAVMSAYGHSSASLLSALDDMARRPLPLSGEVASRIIQSSGEQIQQMTEAVMALGFLGHGPVFDAAMETSQHVRRAHNLLLGDMDPQPGQTVEQAVRELLDQATGSIQRFRQAVQEQLGL